MSQRKLSNAWKSKCLLALVRFGMNATLPGNVAKAEVTSSCWGIHDKIVSCCLGWSKTVDAKNICQAFSGKYGPLTAHSDPDFFNKCNFSSRCPSGSPVEVEEGTPIPPDNSRK